MIAGFRDCLLVLCGMLVMVRGIIIQRPMLRDVVVAGVVCVNTRHQPPVSSRLKCSDQCSFEVCVRPEDGYNVSRNMSPM
jgi:hypothetical protein